MGPQWDPWVITASAYNPTSYGAYPEYGFHFERGNENPKNWKFEAPSLMLPQGMTREGLAHRLELLGILENQLRELDRHARVSGFDRHRQQALSLLADAKVRRAIDGTQADAATQDRHGRNPFGRPAPQGPKLDAAGGG